MGRTVAVLQRAAQRQPLRDAKTMLLVDDRQAQRREDHTVLDQRVRADQQVHLPLGHRLSHRPLVRLLHRAGQPRHPRHRRIDPLNQLAVVLLGQDLGGRHQRHLVAAAHGLQRGKRRNHGLAAAHIALQQPVHRFGAPQVGGNFAPYPLLRAGQLERQPVEQCRGPRSDRQRVGAQCASSQARFAQRQLLRQQFIEDHRAPGRMRAFLERSARLARQRRMQQFDRLAHRHQAQRLALGDWQRVGPAHPLERFADGNPQCRLADARGARVDRREPLRQTDRRSGRLHRGVDHLDAEQTRLHGAVRTHPAPDLQLLELRGIKMEKPQRQPAAGILQFNAQHPPAPTADLLALHHALDLHFIAVAGRRDRHHLRQVHIAKRQVQRIVVVGAQAQLGHARGQRVARGRDVLSLRRRHAGPGRLGFGLGHAGAGGGAQSSTITASTSN